MTNITSEQFDRAEQFLNKATKAEIIGVLDLFKISTHHVTTQKVTRYLTQQPLADKIIDHEENRLGSPMSAWGKDDIRNKSVLDLRIAAKYKGVKSHYQTYREVNTEMTKKQMIEKIIYETDYAGCF